LGPGGKGYGWGDATAAPGFITAQAAVDAAVEHFHRTTGRGR
jgi:hypothetical protein